MNEISAPRTGSPAAQAAPPALSYWQLFRRFLRFGFLAWGGPVAQIAMIRRELVDEERWVSSGRFNRVLAIYQVLPGPEAHELCVYFGMLARGRLGGLLAGLGFMLPGFLLMFALSWLYFAIGIRQSLLAAFFLGVQPAVIALIVRAVHRIGSHVLLDAWLWAIGVVSAVAALLGVSFWITLPTAGLLYALALGQAVHCSGRRARPGPGCDYRHRDARLASRDHRFTRSTTTRAAADRICSCPGSRRDSSLSAAPTR